MKIEIEINDLLEILWRGYDQLFCPSESIIRSIPHINDILKQISEADKEEKYCHLHIDKLGHNMIDGSNIHVLWRKKDWDTNAEREYEKKAQSEARVQKHVKVKQILLRLYEGDLELVKIVLPSYLIKSDEAIDKFIAINNQAEQDMNNDNTSEST